MPKKDVTMYDLMVAIQGVDAKLEGFQHEVNQRFAENRKETDQRFEETRKEMNQRFEENRKEMNQRFEETQKETNDRFDKLDGKIDNMKDHLKFTQKKAQENEKEIFLLKEKIK